MSKPSPLSRALGIAVAAAAVAALARGLDRGRSPAVRSGAAPGRPREPDAPVKAGGTMPLLAEVRVGLKRDNVALTAAGLAFYGLIALVPALIATISIYGLVADPATAERLVEDVAEAVPNGAREIISTQLTRIAGAPSGGLSVGVALSLVGVIWTVSTAFQALIKGINDVYDVPETRGFAVLRGLALLLALGAVVVVLLMASLVTVAPSVAGWFGLSDAADRAIELLRWPAIVVLLAGALALLYVLAPDRPAPRRWWATPGALVGTGLWLTASVGFSIYVSEIGGTSYAATYGTLAGVIILMLWLFMGGFSVLVGAEVNSAVERRRRTASG